MIGRWQWRRRAHDDFADEIRSHIDLETERLVDEGMSPEAARFAAHRRFGSPAAAAERFYEQRRVLWLDHLWQDVRSATRNLRKYPVACTVAVISLAGGIGATTATLTVRDVVFRRPPALYRAPNHLSKVQVGSPDRPIMPSGNPVPGALYAAWRNSSLGASLAAAAPARLWETLFDRRRDAVGAAICRAASTSTPAISWPASGSCACGSSTCRSTR